MAAAVHAGDEGGDADIDALADGITAAREARAGSRGAFRHLYEGYGPMVPPSSPGLELDDDVPMSELTAAESAVGGRTQGWIWQNRGPNKFRPRARGFGWTDCDGDGHPGCGFGLTCGDEGVCE